MSASWCNLSDTSSSRSLGSTRSTLLSTSITCRRSNGAEASRVAVVGHLWLSLYKRQPRCAAGSGEPPEFRERAQRTCGGRGSTLKTSPRSDQRPQHSPPGKRQGVVVERRSVIKTTMRRRRGRKQREKWEGELTALLPAEQTRTTQDTHTHTHKHIHAPTHLQSR